MVLASLAPEEARRLRAEFEESLGGVRQRLPEIMQAGEAADVGEKTPAVLGIPVERVESTLNRVWGGESAGLRVKEFDERWKPEKPEVALIKTTAGDRVLKTEKPETGQTGIVNEGLSQLLYAELNLRSTRMGLDGLRRR